MKVWITKYALSKGILCVEANTYVTDKDLISIGIKPPYDFKYYRKPDWHDNQEDAIIQAEKMRAKKLVAIKKQIDRIHSMNFTIKS